MKKGLCFLTLTLVLVGLSASRLSAAGVPRNYLPVVLKNYGSLNFLAFGDSITGCYFDSLVGDFPYCGYERRVYNRLRMEFGCCAGQFAFYNKSEGGETTADGLARFSATITSPGLPPEKARLYPATSKNTVPDLVIIMEGTNDLNQGVDDLTIESNLSAMVGLARQAGKQVILATIPPTFDPDPGERQHRISQFNPRIFEIAAYYRIPVADVYGRFAGHPEWMSSDGLHPNDAGFDQMADVFFQAIVDLLGLTQ
jgi:lysophospholipase L1-like esterase